MINFPLPSDDRLLQLIRESFEITPGPEMRRLNQLEERLARISTGARPRQKLNTLPWWIVLIVTGTAAAAWWAADMMYPESPVDTQTDGYESSIFGNDEPDRSEPVQDADQQQSQEYESNRESPIIYQREPL